MSIKKYRKTNLFYTSGQDSNFLTFSNYTEAYTGNCLATDWKLYPSKFICLYMPSLLDDEGKIDIEKKKSFIKDYLISYYENKLAILRDLYSLSISDNPDNQPDTINQELDIYADMESNIHSFNWLLEAIVLFEKDNLIDEENKAKVTFVGDVTELDYNGVYNDTICIIDGTQTSVLASLEEDTEITDFYDIDALNSGEDNNGTPIINIPTDTLYGWNIEEDELASINIEEYSTGFTPRFDDINKINKTHCCKISKSEESSIPTSIKFNVVIPLYDIVNIDYNDNFDQIDEYNLILDELVAQSDKQIDRRTRLTVNSPLGIWFSEKEIFLDRDEELKYSPSWSLVISSQFKPFPYSLKYKAPEFSLRDDKHAFATYAQILANQKDFTKLINDLYLQYDSLKEKFSEYIRIVNNITNPTGNEEGVNINDLVDIDNKINNLSNKIDSLENRIELLERRLNDFDRDNSGTDSYENIINSILARLDGIDNKLDNLPETSSSTDLKWKTEY